MLKIGVTGGIGSGKSVVAKIFHILGIPVFDADTEAKKLYDENLFVKNEVIQLLGHEIYSNGFIDKKKLALLIFNNPHTLAAINAIIHPQVQLQFERWCAQQQTPYVIKEAALLVESGSYKKLNELILVTCPIKQRIARTIKRDQSNERDVLQRIHKQLSDDEKKPYCRFEIKNDEQHLLTTQVMEIDNQLRRR